MAEYYKGTVKQATPGATGIVWRQPQAEVGNDLKISNFMEVDATLPSCKLHISFPLTGTEQYRVDGTTYRIKKGEYIILNANQPARIEWQADAGVEGACLFLTSETIATVAQGLQIPLVQSLEHPLDAPSFPEFPVKAYNMRENALGKYLHGLLPVFQCPPSQLLAPDWDSLYIGLAAALLGTHLQVSQQLKSLPYLKSATKQEVFKRLSLAHSHLLEHFQQPVSLEELSKVAMLSRFHLIRLYRQLYGLSPHQHLLQLRIEHAGRLLKNGVSPTEVAHRLSFSDRRAFSKAFKKVTGTTPSSLAASF